MMAGKLRYTEAELIDAFRDCKKAEGSQDGIVQRVALYLGCTRQTVHNYINRSHKIWEVYMRVRTNYGITWPTKIDVTKVNLNLRNELRQLL